jgi:hypothetical protein
MVRVRNSRFHRRGNLLHPGETVSEPCGSAIALRFWLASEDQPNDPEGLDQAERPLFPSMRPCKEPGQEFAWRKVGGQGLSEMTRAIAKRSTMDTR